MAEALAAYRGPITKCQPESELKSVLSSSSNRIEAVVAAGAMKRKLWTDKIDQITA
jgi:hypothetical protein